MRDLRLVLRPNDIIRVHACHGLASVGHGVRPLGGWIPLVALHHRIGREVGVLAAVEQVWTRAFLWASKRN